MIYTKKPPASTPNAHARVVPNDQRDGKGQADEGMGWDGMDTGLHAPPISKDSRRHIKPEPASCTCSKSRKGWRANGDFFLEVNFDADRTREGKRSRERPGSRTGKR